MNEEREFSSAWKILESQWMKAFLPRHLKNHSHFLIRFYDDVIEVICKDLLFGAAPFNLADAIDSYPQMAYPYYQLAFSQEKSGDIRGALKSLEKYRDLIPDSESKDSAERPIERLRKG